jgi:hypothetical protein
MFRDSEVLMYGNYPPCLIFVNSNISEASKAKLISQLFMDEVISYSEYLSRKAIAPEYAGVLHSLGGKVMVLKDMSDQQDNDEADIVLYVAHGLVCVQQSFVGPCGANWRLDSINPNSLFYRPGLNGTSNVK